jgi:hypothetical protein
VNTLLGFCGGFDVALGAEDGGIEANDAGAGDEVCWRVELPDILVCGLI